MNADRRGGTQSQPRPPDQKPHLGFHPKSFSSSASREVRAPHPPPQKYMTLEPTTKSRVQAPRTELEQLGRPWGVRCLWAASSARSWGQGHPQTEQAASM